MPITQKALVKFICACGFPVILRYFLGSYAKIFIKNACLFLNCIKTNQSTKTLQLIKISLTKSLNAKRNSEKRYTLRHANDT